LNIADVEKWFPYREAEMLDTSKETGFEINGKTKLSYDRHQNLERDHSVKIDSKFAEYLTKVKMFGEKD
jgi:hypothetical protein